MNRTFLIPVIATVLLAGAALADNAPSNDQAAPAGSDQHQGPWHHHMGHWMHKDPLADVPKPMTADAVKQALDAEFAKRPQVKSVTEAGPNILRIEIVMPDGKVHAFEVNKTTGERRRAW